MVGLPVFQSLQRPRSRSLVRLDLGGQSNLAVESILFLSLVSGKRDNRLGIPQWTNTYIHFRCIRLYPTFFRFFFIYSLFYILLFSPTAFRVLLAFMETDQDRLLALNDWIHRQAKSVKKERVHYSFMEPDWNKSKSEIHPSYFFAHIYNICCWKINDNVPNFFVGTRREKSIMNPSPYSARKRNLSKYKRSHTEWQTEVKRMAPYNPPYGQGSSAGRGENDDRINVQMLSGRIKWITKTGQTERNFFFFLSS